MNEGNNKVYMIPNPPIPNKPVEFDPSICDGCNQCVEVCRSDVLMPNPEKGKPPIVLYADECWYGGSCVEECPHPGAVKLLHPLNQRIVVSWKDKETGRIFRLGMHNPPPPYDKPPVR